MDLLQNLEIVKFLYRYDWASLLTSPDARDLQIYDFGNRNILRINRKYLFTRRGSAAEFTEQVVLQNQGSLW